MKPWAPSPEKGWEEFVRTELSGPSFYGSEGGGVVAATDHHHFVGFQILWASIILTHPDMRIGLYDLGLTQEQKDWVKQSNVVLLDLPSDLVVPRGYPYWQNWNRPVFLLNAPFNPVIWLDCDCVVLDNLISLLLYAREQPFFCPNEVPCSIEEVFYTKFGMPHREENFQVCSGVMSINLKREGDTYLLNKWKELTAIIIDHPDNLPQYIPLRDQSILRLILQMLHRTNEVWWDHRWNKLVHEKRVGITNTLWDIRNRFRGQYILHFYGSPKYWHYHQFDCLPIPPTFK